MTNAKAAHESRNFFLKGPVGRLEAILWTPASQARMAALVCHPHPLFGGTMHNKVVYQAAKTLDALGLAVLRFNFRGAGMSGGTHDRGRGEEEDVQELIGLGTPVNSSDFSYLRNCSKPKLFVHGANDEHGDIGKVEALVESLPGENRLVVVARADHFFVGKLELVDEAIRSWLQERHPEITSAQS
jgi:alpha/beta superfamily hydrolase